MGKATSLYGAFVRPERVRIGDYPPVDFEDELEERNVISDMNHYQKCSNNILNSNLQASSVQNSTAVSQEYIVD